jgi:hypothetical protein
MNFNNFYGILALITAFLFLGQTILGLIGGFGDGLDLDADTDADLDVDGGDSGGVGFELSSLVSPKGFLHFLLGGSWYLVLANYVRGGFVTWYDYLIAIGVGFLLTLALGLIYWSMMKLESDNKPEEGSVLIGRGGTIYLAGNDNNVHVINVTINGSKTELTVKSKSGKKYNTGDLVRIESYESGIYYIE